MSKKIGLVLMLGVVVVLGFITSSSILAGCAGKVPLPTTYVQTSTITNTPTVTRTPTP